MPLLDLWRLIFKYTFDKKNCSYKTPSIIQDNIMLWNDLVQAQKRIMTKKFGPGFDNFIPVGKKGSFIDEVEYQIGLMSSWIVREERGEFESRVDSYRKAKIDYRLAEPMCKVFPECAIKRNFKGGIEALRQAMKDNPEDYN